MPRPIKIPPPSRAPSINGHIAKRRRRAVTMKHGTTPTGIYRFSFPQKCVKEYLYCSSISRKRKQVMELINMLMEARIAHYYRRLAVMPQESGREIIRGSDVELLCKMNVLPNIY